MVNPDGPTDAELEHERIDVYARIRSANAHLIERAIEHGVTFQLEEEDTLRITLGAVRHGVYAQRIGQVRINVDRDTDEIVGFVIDRITEYVRDHPDHTGGLTALLPALRRLGVVQIPPQTASTEALRDDFIELVPV